MNHTRFQKMLHNQRWTNSKNFRVAVAHEEMNARKRHTMEDVHRVIENLFDNSDDSYSYFGVYDGPLIQ